MENYFYLLNKNLIFFNYNALNIFLILGIIFGILTILNNNPIYSVLLLICLFLSISIYLILIGSTFIGISYILVYIGAISILFLFTVMLVNIRLSELLLDDNKMIFLALFIGLNLYFFMNKIFSTLRYNSIENILNQDINIVLTSYWDIAIVTIDSISIIGNLLYTNFSVWFIIISLILLLAMVGSIVLTKK
jgi:NADH-ubiquinone oxidoreductase chain 6